MTKTLTDMTVTEAASKALEIILAGEFEKSQARYKDGGYSWYNPDATWQERLRSDYELDTDDEFDSLADSESAWTTAKNESSGQFTRDGFTAQRVAEYGGEGQGDQYWVVISLSDETTTRYFRKDGYYASYDGGTLDGETTEVHPVEKTVVFYE